MSVILTFTVPGGDLLFARALPGSDARAELDRVVPLDDGRLPFVWVHAPGEGYDDFEATLDSASTVSAAGVVDAFEDRRLYRIEWAELPDDVFAHLKGADAALLDAGGTSDAWEFEVRFSDQDALSAFNERCLDHGVDIDVTGVYRPDPDLGEAFGLTSAQRDTLVTALDSGFYDVPRDTTTVELADEMGISDQSLSERLRRAHASLIENALR